MEEIRVSRSEVLEAVQSRLNWGAGGRRWVVAGLREVPGGFVAECADHPDWIPGFGSRERTAARRRRKRKEEFTARVREELMFFPKGLSKTILHRRMGGRKDSFYRNVNELIADGVLGLRAGPGRGGPHVVYLNGGE